MSPVILALGALAVLTLLALLLAVTALCHARALGHAATQCRTVKDSGLDSEVQGLRSDLEGLAAQVHDLQQLPPQTLIAAPPRGGLNLAKRSQALRLNRHGNSPAQIASTLDIPLQEVELLLKVDRIILSNL
jgi:hypothetical protein